MSSQNRDEKRGEFQYDITLSAKIHPRNEQNHRKNTKITVR